MINLDENWLRERGINASSPAELQDLLARIDKRIRNHLYVLVPGELTRKKVIEYDKMWDDSKDSVIEEAWLKQNLGNYSKLCERVQQTVGEEIRAAKYKKALIKSWSKPNPASNSAQPNKTKVDRSWLRQLGVDGSSTKATMDELVGLAYSELERRVGNTLANEMTNEQLDEFEAALDAGDDDAGEWLEQNIPHYKQVVVDEQEKMGEEVKSANDKEALIMGWGRQRS